jgi:type II secretory pathway component GspD/PulD (secretin)
MLQPGKIDVELNSAPAAEAFARLGREAGQNLLTSESIQGHVTARLQGVVAWEAILALAHSRDCQIINDAGYLVVVPKAPPEEPSEPDIYSQLLFPKHLAAEEAAAILQPLLTPGVGRISCTHGNHPQSIARTQAVLIVDHIGVIERARAILNGVDRPPRTLQISAQIMLVRREGAFRDGVMRALGFGGQAISPQGTLPQMPSGQSGCCDYMALQMPADELCRRIRSLSDAQTVASPSLQVLDRHVAEISIADEECRHALIAAGWRNADVSGSSNLTIRPMIAGDGMIHLEISPGGSLEVAGRRDTQTTSGALSTSVLVPSGGSLVIGEVCQDSHLERPVGTGLFARFLPRRSAGVNTTTELVIVVSACIVQ